MGLEVSAILGISLGLSAIGTGVQVIGAMNQAEAQKEMIALQQKAEAERKKAMELDARRRQLEIIRNQQRARALALTTASSQGAQFSSALGGAYGQIAGQAGTNLLGVNQNLEIGRNLFGINQGISDAQIGMANAGTIMALGSGFSSLGNSIFSSVSAFNKLNQNFSPGAVWGSAYSNPNIPGSLY